MLLRKYCCNFIPRLTETKQEFQSQCLVLTLLFCLRYCREILQSFTLSVLFWSAEFFEIWLRSHFKGESTSVQQIKRPDFIYLCTVGKHCLNVKSVSLLCHQFICSTDKTIQFSPKSSPCINLSLFEQVCDTYPPSTLFALNLTYSQSAHTHIRTHTSIGAALSLNIQKWSFIASSVKPWK